MKKLIFVLLTVFCSLFTAQAQTWQTCDSLCTLYYHNQSFDTAFMYAQQSLALVEKEFGKKDTNYCNTLTMLVEICYNQGKYVQGIQYGNIEKEIRGEIQGKKNIYYATAICNLAVIYNEMGNYSAALPFDIEAMNIDKEILGENNPDFATDLSNLATCYREMGNYSEAEPLLLEAKKIQKELLGEKNDYYANTLNNLAEVYQDMGNYAAAEILYIEAKNIWREMLGVKNTYYAISLDNLAGLYFAMGNYKAAESLYLETKNIRREVLGVKHPDYALSLNNLANLFNAMGNYSAAEPLYLESKNICKETLGEKNPKYAVSLNNLAELYKSMGNNAAAEHLYIEAMNIRKDVLGETHPTYAQSLINMADLYYGMGDYEKAESYYIKNINICLANIKQNFGFLSENEKENYIKTFSKNFNEFSVFALQRYKANPLIAQNLFNITLATKGILLFSSNCILNEIIRSSDTVLVNQYKKWRGLKEDIGRYSQLGKEKLKKMNLRLDSLEDLANTMEKKISLKSNAFSDDRKNNEITWDQVQGRLNDKEAAIEFIRIKSELSLKDNPVKIDTIDNSKGIHDSIVFKREKNDSVFYAALIVRPGYKSPKLISLFDEKKLEEILNKMVGNRGVQILDQPVTDEKSRALYDLIWLPLDSLLKGVKTVYYAPTGLLYKVSFAAMTSAKNKFLFDLYNLKTLNSTRELMNQNNSLYLKPDFTCSIYGGIQYNIDANKLITNANKYKPDDKIVLAQNDKTESKEIKRSGEWIYLKGTLSEAESIEKEFQDAKISTTLYTGENANEESFKSLSSKSPTIIHIATHGFYIADNVNKNTDLEAGNNFKNNKNPLFRSGLIMAGANRVWSGNSAIDGVDDGILTAFEVSNLNLSNTKLVVLSACETGLGEIRGSEGVYGLQRAFKMAGVKYIIMTLWEIRDEVTVEFMSTLYQQWLKGKEIHDAFKFAQDAMRKKYEANYWAAFVLVE